MGYCSYPDDGDITMSCSQIHTPAEWWRQIEFPFRFIQFATVTASNTFKAILFTFEDNAVAIVIAVAEEDTWKEMAGR